MFEIVTDGGVSKQDGCAAAPSTPASWGKELMGLVVTSGGKLRSLFHHNRYSASNQVREGRPAPRPFPPNKPGPQPPAPHSPSE